MQGWGGGWQWQQASVLAVIIIRATREVWTMVVVIIIIWNAASILLLQSFPKGFNNEVETDGDMEGHWCHDWILTL